MTTAPDPTTCGEVGEVSTALPGIQAPQVVHTRPCRLPAGHDSDHDWARARRPAATTSAGSS